MKAKLLLIFCILAGSALQAQTFVSTEPSKKNAVIEEYTGVNCGFCPDGHRITNEIAAANPGRVSVINIHQGYYAVESPYYKTPYGDALAGQTGLTGFPAGTVNRHVFSGGKTSLGRGSWSGSANTILKQDSYVNIAAKAVIDSETRKLTIDVEIYYTGDSPKATNKLNVALLQNNILGPQSNGAAYNPSYMVNGLYKHMHMLRRLLTGQWGETIETTSEGTFVEKTFEYTVPEKSFNIPYKLEDLEIVVFIAEDTQEIITGAKASLEIQK
ncbi:MAG: Omp28-related outer membrane protein [Bacteroidales bacterium]|nr:Omp28-related outer membrane protein [Bacteroidales bacterium]